MVAGALSALVGCTTERVTSNTARTAMQQLVGTEATERAVRGLQWPKLTGRKVFVQAASAGAAEDQKYLEQVVTSELATGGAVIVPKQQQAEFVALALAGSIGTDETKQFFGIPPLQSVLLPVATPEVAFYKSLRQEGYSKIEIQIRDALNGQVVYFDGPASGAAYWTEFTILFMGFYRTDTSRQPGGVVKLPPPHSAAATQSAPRPES